jgi:hypothetical protein
VQSQFLVGAVDDTLARKSGRHIWGAGKNPYRDVVVHEAAHLLHYLKPRKFACTSDGTRRGSWTLNSVIASCSRLHSRLMLDNGCRTGAYGT